MVRVLYTAAIAYFVVSLAVMLPDFVQHPSVTQFTATYVVPFYLIGIALTYRRSPWRLKRWWWLVLGSFLLASGLFFSLHPESMHHNDRREWVFASGMTLMGILTLAARWRATPACAP